MTTRRHAVITGGGSGLGAAIAADLDAIGLETTLLGRTEETLKVQAGKLKHSGYRVVDIASAEGLRHVLGELGAVDILVNNAGIAPSAPFDRHTEDMWRSAFAVNVDGAFRCIQALLPGMLQQGSGRVINIASTSALKGYGYVAAYVASKHALLGLTRALAVEYAGTPVTFNAICPGFAATEMLAASIENIVQKTGRSEAEARAALVSGNPQGRFIDPDEVAAAVRWLISEEARSVTGQAVSISGGETV